MVPPAVQARHGRGGPIRSFPVRDWKAAAQVARRPSARGAGPLQVDVKLQARRIMLAGAETWILMEERRHGRGTSRSDRENVKGYTGCGPNKSGYAGCAG